MAENVPDAKVTAFNSAEYDKLTKLVAGMEEDISARFLRATSGLALNGSLGTFVKPGAPEWKVAGSVQTSANEFGGSVHDHFVALHEEWTKYRVALKDARDTFEKHDDLAKLSAEDFLKDHPELTPPGSSGSSNTPK